MISQSPNKKNVQSSPTDHIYSWEEIVINDNGSLISLYKTSE